MSGLWRWLMAPTHITVGELLALMAAVGAFDWLVYDHWLRCEYYCDGERCRGYRWHKGYHRSKHHTWPRWPR